MTAARSKSVPATRTSDRAATSEDESSSFPVLPPEPSDDLKVPSWIQELANARAGRSSRASSIVSTRTRFSTTTFDDARSVDIQAGGHSFRISRFGDRITDITAPPPYPGPNDDEIVAHDAEDFPSEEVGGGHDNESGHHPHHHHGGRGGRRHARRVRIAMPDNDSSIPPIEEHSVSADTPSRVITDDELRQIIMDLPARLKREFGIGADRAPLDSTDSPYEPSSSTDTTLDNRGQAVASSYTPTSKPASDFQVRGILRNAPEHAPYNTDAGSSTQKGSRWSFTKEGITQRLWNTYNNAKMSPGDNACVYTEGGSAQSHDSTEGLQTDEPAPSHELVVPPTVSDLNELSQVYRSFMRDLDREHRKQLHERGKELAELRLLLHEKDVVYRQQLKGKDFVIDDLKHRLSRLEETLELRIEQAVHVAEDLWEQRWKEHNRQLMVKCGLIKPALQTYSSNATQTDRGDD